MTPTDRRDARAQVPTLLDELAAAVRDAKACADTGDVAGAREKLQHAASMARWVDTIYEATK